MRPCTAIALSCCLLLSGCAGGYAPSQPQPYGPVQQPYPPSQPAPSSLGPVMTYACDDLTTVTLQSGSDTAVVMLNSGLELRLPLQRSGAGFWFATPDYSFRGRGDEATWTNRERAPVACRRRS